VADVPAAASAAPSLEERLTRRKFVVNVGWGIFWAYIAGAIAATARYLFPNVLYEPVTQFKAGPLADLVPNTVSEKWLKEHRTWIVHDGKGVYAMWARCTHLGCTPRWFSNEGRFRCPCHGSNFNLQGDVIAGPAPRPLFRGKISVDERGILIVDMSVGAIKSSRDPNVRENAPYYLKV
jgi:cytochrome b6-f complex iron-sulfur subunit